MSLHDAMIPNNGNEVLKMIEAWCDVNAMSSDISVIQHAANQYSFDIGKAGNLTREAQQLRRQWLSTIKPLVNTGKVMITVVTKSAWNSSSISGLPTALNVSVDAMLHELGLQNSEIAEERGYQRYL